MKNLTILLCVVVALGLTVGVAVAEKSTAGAKAEGPVAKGKVVSVSDKADSIVVKVGEKDETFAVTADTKVVQGREAKTVKDLVAGTAVMVNYKEADGAKTALVIHIAGEKHSK